MAKTTFPQNSSTLESIKPADGGSRVAQDMRNALSALFQGDLSPLRARAQSTPNMTLKVNASLIESFYNQFFRNLLPIAFAGGNSPSVTAPTSNPRIDVLTLNSSGLLAWILGSENASPQVPWSNVPADSVPLCLVYCKTTMDRILNYEDKDTDTTEGYIYQDVRPFFAMGASKFTQLTDAPPNYSGHANKQVRVKSDQTGLEFFSGVTGAEIDVLRDNLALLAFRQAVQGSLSLQKFEDGFVDEFEDESGVDVAASINELYDSVNDLYSPARIGGGIDSNAKLALLMNGSGSSFADSSLSPKTMGVQSSPKQIPYKFNKSAGFFPGNHSPSGDNPRIVIPSHADWSFGTGDYTVEGWFMFLSTGGNAMLFSRNRNTSAGEWEMDVTGSTIIWATSPGGVLLNISYTIQTMTWYHIAVVRSGTSLKLYVNGVEIGSTTSSHDITGSSADIDIGGDTAQNWGFHGWMKEVRVSNSARYTAAFTPSASQFTSDANTKLLLHFDTPATAPLAPCLYLDGAGDWLTFGDSPDWDFGTGDFTIEGWFRYKSLTTNTGLFDVGDYAASSKGVAMNMATSAQLEPRLNGTLLAVVSVDTFQTDRWYHIALCRASGTIRVFVDGVQKYSAANSTDVSGGSNAILGDMTQTGLAEFHGWIKNFRISKNARYTAAFTPTQTPFTADANTVLLILANENNGATSFVDSETTPKTVTRNGNVEIQYQEDWRNTIFKEDGNTGHKPYGKGDKKQKIDFIAPFGAASCFQDGSDDGLDTPDHADFDYGSGDFTVDAWVKFFGTQTSYQTVVGQTINDNSYSVIGAEGGLGNWVLYSTGVVNLNVGGAIQQGVWYHVEWVRSGSNWYLFVNGTLVGSTTGASAWPNYTSKLTVGYEDFNGAISNRYFLNGIMDNVRVSKGVARHTAAFNPPTAEFDQGTLQNMTLIALAQTAQAQPVSTRIVIFEEDVDAITLNTHLKAYASRDGGTTWDQITLVTEGIYETAKNILAGNVDLTGSGTSMKYKLETLSNKDLKIHGVALSWK